MTSKDPASAATNGQVTVILNSIGGSSPGRKLQELVSSHSLNESKEDVREESVDGEQLQYEDRDTPVEQIEHDLDELTHSGAAINDLEVQLTRTKDLYRRTLLEGRARVNQLAKKLHSHIIKSETFVQIWRKAKEVQERSNKAAARYDKASSQHGAAKEMIRVAELQLEDRLKEIAAGEGPSSPSPLDAAWQEMLNHATIKVVQTEKERRDSELEHRGVLEECNQVMTDYRATERKLRTNITKSRPYYEARYRTNQQLVRLKGTIKDLEQKISETKLKYSASLKRLDVLSTEIHMRRGTLDGIHVSRHALDPRQVMSTGNSPVLRHDGQRSPREDTMSVDSLQMSEIGGGYGGSVNELQGDYGGSMGSLPSLNNYSIREHCDKLQKSSASSSSSSPPISRPESPTSSVPPISLFPSSLPPRPPSPLVATPHLLSSPPLVTVSSEPSTSASPSPSVITPPLPSVITPPLPTTPPSLPVTTPLLTSVTITQATLHSSAPSPVLSSPSSSTLIPSSSSSSSSPVVVATVGRVAQSDDLAQVGEEQVEGSCDSSQTLHQVARQVVEKSIDTALSQVQPTLDPSTSADDH